MARDGSSSRRGETAGSISEPPRFPAIFLVSKAMFRSASSSFASRHRFGFTIRQVKNGREETTHAEFLYIPAARASSTS
jgi:hypothetical protein